jgi:hypothetical protein
MAKPSASVDPQTTAKAALAAAMIPTPDDVVSDLDPMAALYYLEQLSWAVLTAWAAYASEQGDLDPEVGADLAETLEGVGTVVGALDAVCARIGLIPLDAVPPES